MSTQDLEARGRALEDAFFEKENKKLRAKMREKKARELTLKELAAASGISDEKVLEHLVDLGISVDTVAALSLIPLVTIGWADGTLETSEREALLRAARNNGVDADSSAHALFESLLDHAPPATLFDAWAEYVGAIKSRLGEDEFRQLRDDVVSRAREVSAAAGGFLNLGSVSRAERDVLDRIEATFGA